MRNLWKRLLTSTILPTLLIFYILIGVIIYKRNPEKTIQKKAIKALVGYSLEYQTTEELKQTYKCDKRIKTSDNVLGNNVSLEYDEHLDVFFVRAFFDNRLSPYNYVRMVALVPSNITLFCQVRSNNTLAYALGANLVTYSPGTPMRVTMTVNNEFARRPPTYMKI